MKPLVFADLALLSPWWLVPAAACVLCALRRPSQGFGSWRELMSPEVLRFLGGESSSSHTRWRWFTAALVALALSAPAVRISDAGTWRHSTAWIAIVDVSRSMTLDDVAPSRLAAARDTAVALSKAAGARPLALVIYSGDAFLVSPPAFDRSLLETHATLLEHGSVPVEGSNVARALSLATSVAMDSGLVSARLFLLSDSAGANRNAISAARHLAESGHRLDVLQFGRGGDAVASAGGVDFDAAALLAREGGGDMLVADAFGSVDLDALDLNDRQADVEGLQAVLWKNLSHWLLLPLLVLLPWWLYRRGT